MTSNARTSALYDHAERELRRAGWLGPDADMPETGEAILGAVAAFSEGGWSGGSEPFGVMILSDLLSFKPLSPLTDDPEEWQDVSEWGGEKGRGLWQSRRRPDAFSEDGGKTYRLQSEARVSYDLRKRPKWLLWKLGRGEQPVGFVRGKNYGKTKLHTSEAARISSDS